MCMSQVEPEFVQPASLLLFQRTYRLLRRRKDFRYRMKVNVLLFAMARELVDASTVELELPDDEATTSSLTAALLREYPALSGVMKTAMLAVNQKYVDRDEDMAISSQDEIAVIPPVSGG